MIAKLKGKVEEIVDDSLIVDVNGVGYLVNVTAQVLLNNQEIDKKIELIIYTDVKENAILLFGFFSNLEKEVFLILKKVKGVGSKLALTIISSLGAENILHCIGKSEVSELTKVSGIGKKTAERIILELRERVIDYLPNTSSVSLIEKTNIINNTNLSSGISSDACLALEKLGFSKEQAGRAIETAISLNKDIENSGDAGNLVREALAHI